MQPQCTVPSGNAKAEISRRRPRSVDDTELDHFTLLFCRGRQRNVQNVITEVHRSTSGLLSCQSCSSKPALPNKLCMYVCMYVLFCSLNFLFNGVLVAVVVVDCLSSLLLCPLNLLFGDVPRCRCRRVLQKVPF